MTTVFTRIIDRLKEAERCASLENASFGFPSELVSSNPHMDPPIKGMPIDEFIKGKVKLHHDTWIRYPLQEAIELLEQQQELIQRLQRLHALLSSRETAHELACIEKLLHAGQKAADRDAGVY